LKKYPIASLTAIAVFIICLLGIFLPEGGEMSTAGAIICAGYAVICLMFLLFQLYAFVRAHTDYDEESEKIKYRVFEAEGIPLSEVKRDNEN
jgi:hypothetical protein